VKKVLILATAALLAAGAPVPAQTLDMSTVKCKDFVTSSKDNVALILMWLQGLYAGEDSSPIVDFGKTEKDAKKLGEYCGKNPDHSVITAADEVVDE
jgi:acid stress chaperone HdeB